MSKRIKTKGCTIGELNALYRAYQSSFSLILKTEQKHMLPSITTTLGDINQARIRLGKELDEYSRSIGEDYWNEMDKHNTDFYLKYIEDWDAERCRKALENIGSHYSQCKQAIKQRLQMLEVLGL